MLVVETSGEVSAIIPLQEHADNCDLDLMREKDLRHFVEYKNRCMAMKGVNERKRSDISDGTQSKEIKEILKEFSEVFHTPNSLPSTKAEDHEILLNLGA